MGSLADLAFVSGHGCGVDDHTALAVDWLGESNPRSGQTEQVERAHRVDPHNPLEVLKRERSASTDDPSGSRHACTAHRDAQGLQAGCDLNTFRELLAVGNVCAAVTADSPSDSTAV